MDDCAPDSVIVPEILDYYVCDKCFDFDCAAGYPETLGIRYYNNPCQHEIKQTYIRYRFPQE